MTKISFPKAREILLAHKAISSDDLVRVANESNPVFGYYKDTHEYALSLGLDIKVILTAPQKQILRTMQILNCTRMGLVGEYDYTHTRILIAMRAAGEYNLTTDAIAALAANEIKPGVETRGVTRGQVNTIFDRAHKMQTVLTKVSNSVGKNGYMTLTGMTSRTGSTHAVINRNAGHPLALAFYGVIDGASEGQLRALSDKGNRK